MFAHWSSPNHIPTNLGVRFKKMSHLRPNSLGFPIFSVNDQRGFLHIKVNKANFSFLSFFLYIQWM